MSHQYSLENKNISRAQRLIIKDQYKQEFDHANTHLTLAYMKLTECSFDVFLLHEFAQAAEGLLIICEKYDDQKKLIRLCEWVEARMAEQQSISQKAEHKREGKKYRLIFKRLYQ